MMFDFLGEPQCAASINKAVESSLSDGLVRTPDLGGDADTKLVEQDIVDRIHRMHG